MNNIENKTAKNSLNKLNEAVSLIMDAKSDISDFLSDDEFLTLNADQINIRLDTLSRLMLKYGDTEEKMLEFLNNAKSELENITFADKRINELSTQLDIST